MDYMYKSLPTKSIVNIRDLGGYPTEDGGITKCGVFVRSATLNYASREDIDFLSGYGITLNLDFRHNSQKIEYPSPFMDDDRFQYVHIPVYLRVNRNSEFDSNFSWGNEYPKSIDINKAWIKRVIEEIIKTDGGCIFNCATGKDRTGVIAAILLLLAKVNPDDIISDYAVSEIYIQRNTCKMMSLLPSVVMQNGIVDYSNPFFRSAPEYMENLINHIFMRYGSIDSYLEYCGVLLSDINKIRNRFVMY